MNSSLSQVRAQDECVLANLKQYGCADLFVDVLVSDFSRSMWHRSMQFDSIITDRKCLRMSPSAHQSLQFPHFSSVWDSRGNGKNRNEESTSGDQGECRNSSPLSIDVSLQFGASLRRFIEIFGEAFANGRSSSLLDPNIQVRTV